MGLETAILTIGSDCGRFMLLSWSVWLPVTNPLHSGRGSPLIAREEGHQIGARALRLKDWTGEGLRDVTICNDLRLGFWAEGGECSEYSRNARRWGRTRGTIQEQTNCNRQESNTETDKGKALGRTAAGTEWSISGRNRWGDCACQSGATGAR